MCSLEKETSKRWGFIFMAIFTLFGCILIILTGIDWQAANMPWIKSPWAAAGPIQLAATLYLLCIGAYGMITFCRDSFVMTFILIVLLISSIVFLAAVSIFALVAGSGTFFHQYISCSSKYPRLMEAFQGVDAYLVAVDSEFCFKNCPCTFTNTTGYYTNNTIAPFYNQWYKTTTFGNNNVTINIGNGITTYGATHFANCSSTVQNTAYNNYLAMDAYSNYTIKDTALFAEYYEKIERYFQCTGFCNTDYYNPYTKTDMVMWKYLFTGINKGPPLRLGCMREVAKWLPQVVVSYGAVGIFTCALMGVALYFAFNFCLAQKENRGMGGGKGPSQQ